MKTPLMKKRTKMRTRAAPMFNKAAELLKDNSPLLLSIAASIGVIATAVLTADATVKAKKKIEEDSRKEHDGDSKAATLVETLKTSWMYYIPTIAVGSATIVCILSANALNRKKQAALSTAYGLLSHQFTRYKEKVIEKCGKDTHDEIMRSLHVENAEKKHIHAPGLVWDSSLDFKNANEEKRLFYDCFSERYFTATISQVLEAEYHLNRNFMLNGGSIDVEEFYDLLGLDTPEEYKDLGWWVCDEYLWIDFNHVESFIDDGPNNDPIQYWAIEMVFLPEAEPRDF